MTRVRGTAIWLVILLAAGCGGRSSEPNEVNAFSVADAMQPDGPLRGVAFTGHVDRENPDIRPTLGFTTNDTEATAVIGLGDLDEGSTVTVTWYRVEGLETRAALFSHEIAVGPGGLAFSQAIVANGLAPGVYDTAATMGDHVTHTPFVVHEAGASEAGVTGQGASGDEDWNVPEKGDSWWDEFGGEPPPPGPPADTCTFDSINGGTVPMRDVQGHAFWVGPCSTGTLTATVSGPPTTLASSDDFDGYISALHGQTDVCGLSGGSDLPGTVVRFEATGSANGSQDYTLPDYGEALLADLEGLPAAGSKVQPGDRIAIHALAMVMNPALGVKTLYVDNGSDLLESVGNLSGSAEPAPCDLRRLLAQLVTEYTVPADAPPVIELCATGVGFDGTESKNCIQYYTGEVWEGSVTGEAVQAACTPASVPITGKLTVQVASDGKVSGTVTEQRPGFTCGGVPAPDFEQTYQITGRKTAEAFELNVGTLPITGRRATMTVQNVNSGYGATVTYTIDCATC